MCVFALLRTKFLFVLNNSKFLRRFPMLLFDCQRRSVIGGRWGHFIGGTHTSRCRERECRGTISLHLEGIPLIRTCIGD